MKKINNRIGNIELRSTGKFLILEDPIITLEIVLWSVKSCITLAYFDTKTYDMKTVGGRPFLEDVDANDFMTLASYGWDVFYSEYSEIIDGI